MELNKSQIEVVNHEKGPALVLAVPGSGKTTVLLKRLERLIKSSVNPEKILSLTFSRASATDMKARYAKLTELNESPKISTIHSFCYTVISKYFHSNGTSFQIIDSSSAETDRYKIISSIYKEMFHSPLTDTKYELLNNLYGYAINMMQSYEDVFKKHGSGATHFLDIVKAFDRYKTDKHLLDFDDMLRLAYKILKTNKSLLNSYRKQFEFIQIDEGQDTSKLQLEIIKMLGETHKNVLIVADDDQSIYNFRGANPQGLFSFSKEWNDVKLYYLENNYRSTKNIVECSKKFIANNRIRFNKNVFPTRGYNEPIEIIRVEDTRAQSDYVSNLISISEASDWAILYRNNFSVLSIVETFENKGIEFKIKDADLSFFKHWIIKDINAIMTVANNPSDITTFEEIFYKIKGFTSRAQLSQIKKAPVSNIFHELISIKGLPDYYKKNFSELSTLFHRLSKQTPYKALHIIENELKYGEYLKDYSDKFGFSKEQLLSFYSCLKMIAKPCETYKEFIARLKHLELIIANGRTLKTGATLSTVHGSKGLEFKNVIIIDACDEEFPSSSAIENFKNGDIVAIEEERRLFYVAMTRAKEKLYIISPKKIYCNDAKQSRFIDELINIDKRQKE